MKGNSKLQRSRKRFILGKKGEKTEPPEQVIEAAARPLHVLLKKKAGTIKSSSRRWLDRQLNDPYVVRAKIDGYRSRAAYKLLEINERYNFLKKGQKIVDLGAAPGGWCQVASRIIGADGPSSSIVAIDYLPMDPLAGVSVLELDFLSDGAQNKLIEVLGQSPDVVLSDMAAPTIGHKRTDHYRTMHLCEVAMDFAIDVLKPKGTFLAKTFQGGTEGEILKKLHRYFTKVHHVKPPSSRAESVELYILALDFKGNNL
ncbi:RlmE family RNA methyltransferase [Bartonella sp. TP]|uniref:RlmE family RNA methyltransferase n=1 Tax=Bartonella sp. TP TaxID=3057550 RepID=UPI00339D6D01